MTTVTQKSYRHFLEHVLRMDAVERKRDLAHTQARLASVRVVPYGYGALMAWLTCTAVLALRFQYDAVAVTGLITAWLVLPWLAWQDRVHFDGRNLTRHGVRARWARMFTRHGASVLALEQIESIATEARRSLRHGGRVYYRYRCTVRGAGQVLVIASGGAAFRHLVRALFAQVPDEKLDARSRELRDHLVAPAMLARTLERLALASENLLETTDDQAQRRARRTASGSQRQATVQSEAAQAEDWARGQLLRRAANELYVLGRMSEAAEAFRRAWRILPRDGWLLYEMGRFWHSQAGAQRDARLWRRGNAALRLAARYGAHDAALQMRLAESWLEYNEPRRAEKILRRLVEGGDVAESLPDGVESSARGASSDNAKAYAFRAAFSLAELGLRRGQGAHIRHHYGSAVRYASDAALARQARREYDYYTRLSEDEKFLATELRRLKVLEWSAQFGATARRVTFCGLLLGLLGPSVHASLGLVGWSLAALGLPLWAAAGMMSDE